MPTRTLWALLTYGLDLDNLPQRPPVDLDLDGAVPELLCAMLLVEAQSLWRSGLARGYVGQERWLVAPRGRPDLATLARHLPLTRAALPCHYQAFTADTLDNQVILAGLRLATRLTGAPRLRAALHRAHQRWATACSAIPLSSPTLDAADRGRNRLTARYRGAHRLVRALMEGSGPDDALRLGDGTLHGALWNMALLFERAVARFLAEHLPSDHEVVTQHQLSHLYSVDAGGPRHRAPGPRPDLVVSRARQPLAVLDTKYRDLSRTPLPREILYQLSVYSLPYGGQRSVPAVVLYAVPSGDRPDVRIRLHVAGAADRHIVLRAVPLERLVEVVQRREAAVKEARRLIGADLEPPWPSAHPTRQTWGAT